MTALFWWCACPHRETEKLPCDFAPCRYISGIRRPYCTYQHGKRRAHFLVKGISRRVIVVDSPDPRIFEQAIFIIRNEAAAGGGGVTSQQLVDQAVRIAKNYARTHGGGTACPRWNASPWLWTLLGGAATGLVWLLVYLI